MTFIRSIGRWTMTALVINCIIGSGIFGLSGELTRLLGRASPFAMIFAALGMAVIMACIAEVASQFSEPGGAYLYARTAFGRFFGMQIGWFELLSVTGGLAAVASLFLNYFTAFLPWSLNTWERGALLAIVIAIPAVVNYLGVRSGANLSSVMTVAKLSPLAVADPVRRGALLTAAANDSRLGNRVSGIVELGERNGTPGVRLRRMGGWTASRRRG